ncbi:glycosyltransferase [Umezawaea beigongshangensis]|uniref:glycosyltransferase n=1 Tax=Umezawaea beigongshangensis TaxID=2780383 RepID=UPI0018F157ED|nr:glycosyltransferase [Umezawaea beigongshangensis]
MRIAVVSEHASPLAARGGADAGGQHVHVAELATALSGLGHEVEVFTRRDAGDLPERVRTPEGYDVVHVPAGPAAPVPRTEALPHVGDFTRFLVDRWKEQRPDVVHSHFWTSGLAAVLAAHEVGLPVVHTSHALSAVERRHPGALADAAERPGAERLVGRRADRVIATCTDEVFELMRFGVPRSSISIVPWGVDTDLFAPVGPSAQRGESHRLVAVGELAPHRGFDTIVHALRALPDTELVIVGGSREGGLDSHPEVARLLRGATALGVARRVRFTGPMERDELPALLRSADAVVCTPSYEPSGVVALEAMACAVPVVASDVGGLTDVVVHGVTGLHVPPRDPEALVRAVRVVQTDRARHEGFGLAGCDRVQACYTWDRVAADVLRVYARAGVPVPTPEPVQDQVPDSAHDGVVSAG